MAVSSNVPDRESAGRPSVVLLTQYFPPETGAPQQRLGSLCASMASGGWEVTVLTAKPNYPRGVMFDGWAGIRATTSEEPFGRVLRCWLVPSSSPSLSRRLLTYATFGASALGVAVAQFRGKRADYLIWESPPLFLAPVAFLIAKLLRARVVMNVSDLWPESVVAVGALKKGVALRMMRGLERWAYRKAHIVTCQTTGIVQGVEAVAPAVRAIVFPNGVDLDRWPPPAVCDPSAERLGDLQVLYAGNLGRAQALEQLLDAAARLKHLNVRFVLAGAGPRESALRARAAELDLQNVEFAGHVSFELAQRLLYDADLCVVPLARGSLFEGARPSKLFEAMAAGTPFVYCGSGEGADLANASGGGLVVPPEDPESLANALERLAALRHFDRSQMGLEGRRFVESRFDRRQINRSLLEVLAAEGL